MSRTKAVRDTDNDALLSKAAAVAQGYFADPLIPLLLPPPSPSSSSRSSTPPPRRLPLINRGTYIRHAAVSRLVDAFIHSGGKQIISLGAGSDTRPFHLLARAPDLIYHELDFAVSARAKAVLVRRHSQLNSVLDPERTVYNIPEPARSSFAAFTAAKTQRSSHLPSSTVEAALTSPNYYIHGLDLRSLTSSSSILALPGLDPSLSTLIISECCLCYLEPAEADLVLSSILSVFSSSPSTAASPSPQLGIVSYEPFSLSDSFGKVMVQNLASRGISIPAMIAFPTLRAQLDRLRNLGFTIASGADVKFIHDIWIDDSDRQRIDSLEVLDEREEFDLLAKHYGVYWACTQSADPLEFCGVFANWSVFPHQT
ncbi:S-adenosyl-L-methionine-dependent methyltransferase [Kockiozyma suomiensis]|uniref:S-adenosyl-L-methionine-dependent methyltransferase n=1 Tax=Kockiozyma suomiensis TaxID=1337062 RepID=UPI003342F3CE